MQVKKIIIKNLHGYINKTILFNDDITLLVGINGSGKTSILNIINWVLTPSIAHMCITEFKSIQTFIRIDEVDYEIVCKHNKTNFTYNIISTNEKFNPLIVKIRTPPAEIRTEETRISLIAHYSSLHPDNKEKKTWALISKFPNPSVIGLDRNFFTVEDNKLYLDEENGRTSNGKRLSLQTLSPLERIKEIVNTEYRKKKNSILNLTSNLKNHLMLSTFAGSITKESITSGIRHKLNINQIIGAEKRVNDYFQNFEKKQLTSQEQQTISLYFSQLKDITMEYQNDSSDETTKLLYGLNASQFVKVNKLLKEFEKFERESNKALEKINLYIETLNFFLKDSAKKLLFKEDTSELAFHTMDRKGYITTEFRDIKYLSSGEQQLLVLFSYIAFNSQDGKLYIIDEPELSLHIKWQEEFLNQLEKITPSGVQLILATHSPILADKKRQKTELLLPYN